MQIAPLHVHIADQLERDIRASRQPGDRLESERELAKRLEVSQATVAKALAVLTQRGLVSRRHGSGTYVAEVAEDNRWLGVLVEYDIGSQHSSYFFRALAQRCRELFEEGGWMARLYAGFSDFENPSEAPTCREFLYDLERNSLAGLVVMAGADQAGSLALAKSRGVPVAGLGIDCTYRVVSDRRAVLKKFVEHALAQGRTRFALLDWEEGGHGAEFRNDFSIRDSFRGVLAEHGIDVNPEWIRGDLHPTLPGAGWEEFREVWGACGEHPDVLIIGDEHLLPDVERALQGLNIHPENISIYSYSTRGNVMGNTFPVVFAELDVDAVATALVKAILAAQRDPSMAPSLTTVSHHWNQLSQRGDGGEVGVDARLDGLTTPVEQLQLPNS